MTHEAAFAAAAAEEAVEAYPFRWSDPDDPYLAELRAAYALDAAAGAGSDLERARALTAWVHGRWFARPTQPGLSPLRLQPVVAEEVHELEVVAGAGGAPPWPGASGGLERFSI